MQNFPRILQIYLILNAFFSKILVKSQENFEKNVRKTLLKSQEKTGKNSQHDLWQPWIWIVFSYSNRLNPDIFSILDSDLKRQYTTKPGYLM